jgi:uncharacterized membrane protein
MTEAFNVIMRWLHISSMMLLLGGVLFARLAVSPVLATLSPEMRAQVGDAIAARFRSWMYTAIAVLLLTGLYNLFLNISGKPPLYHMLIGLKLLLALHVFAVGFLIVQPRNPKRVRLMTGLVVSGLVILLLSAWLRQLHLN